jgi:cystathionine beta-lyase
MTHALGTRASGKYYEKSDKGGARPECRNARRAQCHALIMPRPAVLRKPRPMPAGPARLRKAGGMNCPDDDGFDELPLAWLQARPGCKWAEAGPGVLPCWVADMDFPAPLPVRRALADLVSTGDLGYPTGDDPARVGERWAARMAARYGWAPAAGQVVLFTDLVQAAQVLLQVASAPGDGVLLFTPAYPPFLAAVTGMGRRLLAVPAVDEGDRWGFDLDAAARLAPDAAMVLLVNPHNPTGRMLSAEELGAVAELAERHDLVVVSDEIHADLSFEDRPHLPFGSLSAAAAARTVTLYSASKSYNLGGMRCAVAHVGHPGTRQALSRLPSRMLGGPGRAAIEATLASWTSDGDAWLERCLGRLGANRDKLSHWVAGAGAELGVRAHKPEATYLEWLDFRAAGLGDDPAAWLLSEARVMLSPGPSFGPGGAGFARLNFATAPGVLDDILGRVGAALSRRGRPPG